MARNILILGASYGSLLATKLLMAGQLTTGQKWGKWIQPDPSQGNYTPPATSLDGTESAHYADLLAIQVGDEQQGALGRPKAFLRPGDVDLRLPQVFDEFLDRDEFRRRTAGFLEHTPLVLLEP